MMTVVSAVFGMRKSVILADDAEKYTFKKSSSLVKSGGVYVSNAEVHTEADFFDTDLNNFLIEVDENPVFGLRQYEKFDDEKKKSEHQKFVTAASGLVYDWRGDDDEQKGTLDFFPGYYRYLKDKSWGGATEMSEVKAFEASLKSLKKMYTDLGYKLTIPDVKPPSDPSFKPPPVDIPWGWITIGGVVIVGGIVIAMILPEIMTAKALGSAASAR